MRSLPPWRRTVADSDTRKRLVGFAAHHEPLQGRSNYAAPVRNNPLISLPVSEHLFCAARLSPLLSGNEGGSARVYQREPPSNHSTGWNAIATAARSVASHMPKRIHRCRAPG
jgi:hypothetical protein